MAFDLNDILGGQIPSLPSLPKVGMPPNMGSIPQAVGGSGLLSGLAGPIGAGIQLAGLIGGPIQAHQQELKSRDTAAKLQRTIEQTALDIEKAVNEGRMDPDAAIASLKRIASQGVGGDANQQRGGQYASLLVQQVLSRIESKRTQGLSAPFNPGDGNPTNFDLTGSSDFQRQRMGTALRNYMLGTDLGHQITDTPLAQLTRPGASPLARFDQYSPIAGQYQPIDFTKLRGDRRIGERKF